MIQDGLLSEISHHHTRWISSHRRAPLMRNRLDVHRNSQGPSALTIDGLRTFELRIASLTMSLMQQTSKNIPSLIHIPNKRLNMFLPPKKPSKSSKIGAVFFCGQHFLPGGVGGDGGHQSVPGQLKGISERPPGPPRNTALLRDYFPPGN